MARQLTSKPGRGNILTPSDVLDAHPDLSDKLGWTTNDIGNLLRMKILTGTRNGHKKITLIHRDSLRPLLELVNKNLDRSKIKI